MAKYKYTDSDYRPKDTSLEVYDMLMDDENSDSYGRDKERSFNPITDPDPVHEHIEYEHKRDALFNPELDFAGEKKNKNNSLKALTKRAHKNVKEAFEAVVQSMLVTENLQELKSEEKKHSAKEAVREFHVNHAPRLNDVPHSHVDAVLLEHSSEHVRLR
jgi:hypothetical protein